MWYLLYLSMKSIFLILNVLKAAVRKYCFFVALLVWKPGIAVTCGIIFIAWVVLWHGSSADESNVFEEYV